MLIIFALIPRFNSMAPQSVPPVQHLGAEDWPCPPDKGDIVVLKDRPTEYWQVYDRMFAATSGFAVTVFVQPFARTLSMPSEKPLAEARKPIP